MASSDPQHVVIDRLVHDLAAVLHQVDCDVADSARPRVWSRMRAVIDGAEARYFASKIDDGSSDKNIEHALRNSGASKRDAKKRTRRARAVNKNPDLGSKMSTGDASAEQIDTIADADERSDGAAATDSDLIDDVLGVDPDRGRVAARRWLRDREDDDAAAARHRRERQDRTAYRTTIDETPAIVLKGDELSIAQLWARIAAEADLAYRSAGGRDVAPGDHVPLSHRLFDAVQSIINGGGSGNGAGGRPTVVLCATVAEGQVTGLELAGGQKLPVSLLEELAGDVDFLGMIFGTQGQPLWLGRRVRHATKGQVLALIARDRACVLCGAAHQSCDAHHLIPWNAPLKGESNIDNLALVCPSCHRWLHDNNKTLVRCADSGRWRHRPSTSHETPPPRPSTGRHTRAGKSAEHEERVRQSCAPDGRLFADLR